jgi:hypothetical protein
MRMWIRISVVTLAMVVLGVFAAQAQLPDWSAVADTETVEVLTEDEDGSLRVTTVWLLVLDGEGYVRTGGTSWGANVVRSGNLTLRIDENEYPLGVEFEEDEDLRAQIEQGFRDKYGWSDGLIGWIRGNHPLHMHLVSQ